jgi:hypothetical protein
MNWSFNISLGLATPDGNCYFVQARGTNNKSSADRNVDNVIENNKNARGVLGKYKNLSGNAEISKNCTKPEIHHQHTLIGRRFGTKPPKKL